MAGTKPGPADHSNEPPIASNSYHQLCGQGLTANCVGDGGGILYLCLVATCGFGFAGACLSDDRVSAMAFSFGSGARSLGTVAATAAAAGGSPEGTDVSNWKRCGHLF